MRERRTLEGTVSYSGFANDGPLTCSHRVLFPSKLGRPEKTPPLMLLPIIAELDNGLRTILGAQEDGSITGTVMRRNTRSTFAGRAAVNSFPPLKNIVAVEVAFLGSSDSMKPCFRCAVRCRTW